MEKSIIERMGCCCSACQRNVWISIGETPTWCPCGGHLVETQLRYIGPPSPKRIETVDGMNYRVPDYTKPIERAIAYENNPQFVV